MINYTPFGHSDWQTDRRRHQEVRLGRQEDRRGLDHQRRRQRALLQGTRQPGHQGHRHPGRRLLGRRRRARRHRHQAARRPPRRLELLPVDRHAREQGVHREVARLHQEPEARHQRPDGSPLHRLQHVGEGGREGRHHRSATRSSTPCPASELPNLTGGISEMLPNHHITKPVLIGEIEDDGQFDVVWKTDGLVARRRVVGLARGLARTSRPIGSS